MFKHTRHAVFIALLALFVAFASPAVAASAPWTFVDVGLHLEEGRQLLLVSGDLPEGTPLPFEAELAVPVGTQLQWIGEILGGPPAEDPALKYVKTTQGDMDVYRFTLTKSRTAQIEGIVTGIAGADGTSQTTALKWTAWQDLPSVRIAQRLPRGSQIVQQAEGAATQPGDESFSYYSKTVTNVKAGDSLDLTFAYTLPTSVPSAGTSGSGSSTIATVIIVAAVLLLLGIVFVAVRRRPAPAAQQAAPAAPARADGPKPKHGAPKQQPAPEPAPRPNALLSPKVIISGALVAVVVITFAALGNGTSLKDGKITKFFGAPSACQSTSLALMPNQGVDLTRRGEEIVDAFTGSDGIGDVTLNVGSSTLDVTFCESSQSEESVRQIVEGTGLVSLTAAPSASVPTTATVDPTGSKQTAAVDTSTGDFEPNTVVLAAGIPAEIAFGPAVSCMTEVVIEALGINQDLTAGPATVALPPLQAGTYAFACAMGHQTGSIVVQ